MTREDFMTSLAIDFAILRQGRAIRRQLAENLVSRESQRGKEAHRGPIINADSRPQVGPSTIHGADKSSNVKDWRNY